MAMCDDQTIQKARTHNMHNRSIGFAAITLITSILSLGWQVAQASAVYPPHRLLPSFIPAAANGGVASFTPRYRFRPLDPRPGRGYAPGRMPSPMAPGHREAVRFRHFSDSRMAQGPAFRQQPGGFRFRPLRPSPVAPVVHYPVAGAVLPSQFARRPQPHYMPNDRWRFAAYLRLWRGTPPITGQGAGYAAAAITPGSRYSGAWGRGYPGGFAAGYRFRPMAESRPRYSGRPPVYAGPGYRLAGTPDWQFRPLAATQRPVSGWRPPFPQSNRMHPDRMAGLQHPIGYRFRPDRRLPVAPHNGGFAGFAPRPPVYGMHRVGRGFEPMASQVLTWRPLEDQQQDRLAGQPSTTGQAVQDSPAAWTQTDWHTQAGRL